MRFSYYWAKLLTKIRGIAISGSTIHPTSKVESGSHIVNSSFDRYSFCGYDCKIINCQIGAFVSIADGVVIGGARHPIEWVGTSPVFYKGKDSVKKKFSQFQRPLEKKTFIGSDVWIGDQAMIKAGVTIGHGAVIGMGSIVTKDVPPYAIVGGNPAQIIRMRFDEYTIEKLLESQWWEMPDIELKRLALYITDTDKFLKRI